MMYLLIFFLEIDEGRERKKERGGQGRETET